MLMVYILDMLLFGGVNIYKGVITVGLFTACLIHSDSIFCLTLLGYYAEGMHAYC